MFGAIGHDVSDLGNTIRYDTTREWALEREKVRVGGHGFGFGFGFGFGVR